MSEMNVHEPGAEWLTPRDVDRDVASLALVLPQRQGAGVESPQGKRPS